jgi:CRP/FNR family transcriptional regulator, cyclic AMP receptor protein
MRVKKQQGIELLRTVWLFERCSKRELDAIQRIATPIDVPAGKALTSEGDIGREFFVIVQGKAEATRGDVRIARLGEGSFFGEMALLDHRPRSATVTTLAPTTVLVITSGAFGMLVDTMPSVDRKMLVTLAERLRDVEARFVPADQRVTKPELD